MLPTKNNTRKGNKKGKQSDFCHCLQMMGITE